MQSSPVRLFMLGMIALSVMAMAQPANGQSLVGRNANAVGPTPDGFYKGIPHYQDNEPHCDRNPLQPGNILCMANGYGGADDAIGDAWPRILETQDNTRTWVSRYVSGSGADTENDLGLEFGADPIVTCWAGGCAGFFIASNRAEGGGTGGGVYMELMPEVNFESGFRHYSKTGGPLTVQLGTGSNFLDKIDAIFMLDTANPGTVEISTTVDLGGGDTLDVVRQWPKGRLLVVYASINSSQQNVRVYSTFSDDFGFSWSPPKQVANTTGIDTGVSVAAIDDTVFYAYRQFEDDSGDNVDAVYGAVSTNRGQTIKKPFVVVDNLCAFDQPTLSAEPTPNPPPFETVASRTNNFVDVTNDGNRFVMVLTNRLLDPTDGCFTTPFDYATGSRVLVTTARSDGKGWKTPIEIAPRDNTDPGFPFPENGHSFQFMPAVDCELGICQVIWYDSIKDSIRSINYLNGQGKTDAVEAFVNYPFFADFYFPRTDENDNILEVLQFRRTADVFTRQFEVNNNGSIGFRDLAPVQVSNYQLVAVTPSVVVEGEQNAFGLKQYKGNTASFMGDYICLASKKMRDLIDPADPTAPPLYEPNYGPDPLNPNLDPSWFACWTDTRNARGLLYTQTLEEPIPFEKTTGGTLGVRTDEVKPDTDSVVPSGKRKLSAEGVEDVNPGADVCTPLDPQPSAGDDLPVAFNLNRIKDADAYGALIEVPDTAWLYNARKGLGDIQRTYVLAARNEDRVVAGEARPDPKTYRFRIMNQPVGWDNEGLDDARASWLQLPFENFDNQIPPETDPTQEPVVVVDEVVEPQSSVTVALFVVSALPVNPVTVNVYQVDNVGETDETETLVETLTVNGAVEAGNLVFITEGTALPNVNVQEIHNPFVYPPTTSEGVDYSNPDVWNPDVWNPDVWNPDVWNPDVWNPDVWNPDVWNPDVWNPDVWNPDVWNPDVWNVGLTSSDDLDNPEIPSPDLDGLQCSEGVECPEDFLYAKFDVQLTAENQGNTATPYTADIAANSSIVRQFLADGLLRTQIIVWQDVDNNSFQACGADLIVDGNFPGQNRILAIANNEDLLNLKIPDIFNNRFGSATYYAAPFEKIQITVRFIGSPQTIRTAAPELVHPGISYVVTSQAANTGESNLDPGIEQAIEDNVPPTMAINSDFLPEPIPLTAEKVNGEVGATLPATPPLVTATKEFETPVVTCTEDGVTNYGLGEFIPVGLGISNIDCSAVADNGAVGEISVELDVDDAVAPVLGALPADAVLERTELDGAFINYPLPSATDNIDDNVEVTCGPIAPGGALAPFNPPEQQTVTEVTCTASDDDPPIPNTDSGSFFVTVQDTTAPDLTVPSPGPVEATSSSGATVNFTPPSASDVGAVSLVCSAESGDTFPIDTTFVECTATDDVGNSTTLQFDVTVNDTTAPDITSVTDFPAPVEANTAGGANLSFTEPTATDLGEQLDVNCDSNPNGDFYPLGDTLVTCTSAADAGGLTASTSFTVTVEDTTDPEITVPADINAIAGESVTFEATATDVADLNPTVVCNPPSGTVFDVGTTVVSCTATDSSGNEDTGTFTVNVQLGGGGLTSNKNSVKSGSVAGFLWSWVDANGNPVDVGEGNQDIEARLTDDGKCPSDNEDVLNEDPGSSDIRRAANDAWQFNWQTVDDLGDPIEAGVYCVTVVLMTTDPVQTQSTEIRVRR